MDKTRSMEEGERKREKRCRPEKSLQFRKPFAL